MSKRRKLFKATFALLPFFLAGCSARIDALPYAESVASSFKAMFLLFWG